MAAEAVAAEVVVEEAVEVAAAEAVEVEVVVVKVEVKVNLPVELDEEQNLLQEARAALEEQPHVVLKHLAQNLPQLDHPEQILMQLQIEKRVEQLQQKQLQQKLRPQTRSAI